MVLIVIFQYDHVANVHEIRFRHKVEIPDTFGIGSISFFFHLPCKISRLFVNTHGNAIFLAIRMPRRSKTAAHRSERPVLNGPHECWSMDFVADQHSVGVAPTRPSSDGRRFRALTLVDNFSRKCSEIEVGQSLKGFDVVDVMERIKQARGIVPKRIQVDNGSEFISKVLDRWAYENGVTLDLSRPEKPTDNPFIESFNGSFRDECLNVNWFMSLDDAVEKIQAFKDDYNGFRPHSSLSGLTPNEAVQKHHENFRLALKKGVAHKPGNVYS